MDFFALENSLLPERNSSKHFNKKKHPCDCDEFKVMRGGSDVRIICSKCQRDLTIEREKLEKMIKKVITANKEGKA